ncbi:MAG: hypothetical protein ACYDGM_02190 [Vulcanimicrobiaceae bacterium]
MKKPRRQKGFIPVPSEHLRSLAPVNADIVACVTSIHRISMRRWIKMRRSWRRINDALFYYKRFRA